METRLLLDYSKPHPFLNRNPSGSSKFPDHFTMTLYDESRTECALY